MAAATHRETLAFPTWPSISETDIAAVTNVLRSSALSQFSSTAVSSFEAALGAFIGSQHVVAVNSGTAALHTALAALQVAPGDEVIVPSHTFIGSASPIVHRGATPVFVDVDARTFCLAPHSVRSSITSRTRAIIAVHLNGAAAPLEEIAEIAADNDIPVIEDVAQALGGQHDGKPLGSIGTLATFSFWEDKIVTTGGEGGAVVTNDEHLADRMRRFRHHGEKRPPGARVYASTEIGHNYRLTAIQAALGTSQLQRVDSFLDARRNNSGQLSAALDAIEGVEVPHVTPGTRHAFWKYVCRVPGSDEATVDRITTKLQDEGVPAFRRYPVPLHRQPAFVRMGLSTDRCPVTEQLTGELFSLPVHPLISSPHIDFMAEKIAKVTATCL